MIFLSFQAITIVHSHFYQLSSFIEFSDPHQNSHAEDIYLDSEFNCTINTFSHNLFDGIESISHSHIQFVEKIEYVIKTSEFHIVIDFTQFNLRAPPLNII